MNATTGHGVRRRTTVAAVIIMIVLVAFVVRLFDIQVVRADDHMNDAQSVGKFEGGATLPGVRGSIVDDKGQVLASTTVRYNAAIDPSLAHNVSRLDDEGDSYVETWGRIAERIGDVVGIEGVEVEKVAEDAIANNPDAEYISLKKGLSTEQYRELLEIDAPMLILEPQKSRSYPNGAVGANLVGFTGADDEPLAGYELLENACLESTDGKITYQRSADAGVRIPGTTTETPAQDGGTLNLTIDTDLSWYLLQMLKEEVETQNAQAGSIMVADVKTGEIKAAVDYPTLDPNTPGETDADNRGAKALTRSFEPGSTFKAITAATVLDQGAATPLTEIKASGYEQFPNGAVVGDSFMHPEYRYTVAGALIDSSNVALSKIGELVPDQTRYDYLEKFGVGQKSPIDFGNAEPSGVLHPVSEWDNQTHYATTFGQAFTVTMQQVVSAYQTLANGGVREPVHIVDSCENADGTTTTADLPASERVVSEEAADETVEILENVAAQGSLADQISIPGYRIGIKTGTAQKTDGNGNYKSGVYFTSMIGIAPIDDPQYVVMVSLDEPRRITSSSANASAFKKAMTQVLKNYRVPPSEEPFEPLPKFKE
ncbi:MAG: peptidoglycan D,D-transpeptidase FtsI family protein [Microbacterium gubbeenense]|uniref:peptidoglycan D,D-transpeptidase FtsI family protein n=1 Tax=Microbacterium gubbeenense TaxID=159896 RepID=UPI003F963266